MGKRFYDGAENRKIRRGLIQWYGMGHLHVAIHSGLTTMLAFFSDALSEVSFVSVVSKRLIPLTVLTVRSTAIDIKNQQCASNNSKASKRKHKLLFCGVDYSYQTEGSALPCCHV